MDLVTRNHANYALVSGFWSLYRSLKSSLPLMSAIPVQKKMLLQVPEQREAAEKEIRTHQLVDNENIVKLITSEIKDQRNGEGVAFLLFPYYRVSYDSGFVTL